MFCCFWNFPFFKINCIFFKLITHQWTLGSLMRMLYLVRQTASSSSLCYIWNLIKSDHVGWHVWSLDLHAGNMLDWTKMLQVIDLFINTFIKFWHCKWTRKLDNQVAEKAIYEEVPELCATASSSPINRGL